MQSKLVQTFERYIKVKKGNVLLSGLVEGSVPFQVSSRVRFYRYIGVNFAFGLLDCVRFIGDIVIPWIVKSRFCSIHFTVKLAGLKNVNRYIGNIFISKIVLSGFHCTLKLTLTLFLLLKITVATMLRGSLIVSLVVSSSTSPPPPRNLLHLKPHLHYRKFGVRLG